ncbi:MAG: MnmC family methyltransferase, partial [Bacteroidota bacterium]
SMVQARQLNYPKLIKESTEAVPFLHFHELEWNVPHQIGDCFKLLKQQIDFEQIEEENRYDIIYFDVFAPNAQPHLWEIPMLERMHRALKKEGLLVTYCAKGIVKRRLKEVGFDIESIPGPPGKREMTRAHKL